MQINFDVLIVGGGLVGSTLACALGDSNLKVGIVERQTAAAPPKTGFDLRVSAMTLASRAIFEAVNVWEGVEQRRYAPIRAMHVWDTNEAGGIQFDAADIGEPSLAYIIENSVLQAALTERLHRLTNVHLVTPAEIAKITVTDERADVWLQDDRQLTARLIVGADGADSVVRRAANITTKTFDMNQQALVAVVRTERPHQAIAWQRFLSTGPLAFLPLPEAQTSSIVWSADQPRADQLLALDDAGFITELQQAFDARLGRIEDISARAAFPLALMHAHAYVAARVALIGDAAHTVHPLAGQGANLGLLDAATLAEVLLEAVSKEKDIGTLPVLRRYERWRKGNNLALLGITGGFKYLFGVDWRPIVTARSLGLDLTNKASLLKNRIMRRASGLEGDLPRLARRTVAG